MAVGTKLRPFEFGKRDTHLAFSKVLCSSPLQAEVGEEHDMRVFV